MQPGNRNVIALGILVLTACSAETAARNAVDGSVVGTGAAGAGGGTGGLTGVGGSTAGGGAGAAGPGGLTGAGGRIAGGSGGSLSAGGSMVAGGAPATSCMQLGGTCQCAGGPCGQGYHGSLASCPQPCPTCGGCSEQCCLRGEVDAGSLRCGTSSCRPNQVCVHPCSGTDPPPPPHCLDVPAACGAAPTCSCFRSDVCGGAGMCTNAAFPTDVLCQGCA